MQTDFQIVRRTNESNMVWTQFLWDYWISSLPAREQSVQINEIVSAIMNSHLGPEKAVERLNGHFSTINFFFWFSRASLFVSMHAV